MIVATNRSYSILSILFSLVLLLNHLNYYNVLCNKNPPHIIFIMADDMGYNDISFHGTTDFITPNIDAIHAYGIGLRRYYTAPACTPSRASLMTGKYPSNLGLQNFVIPNPAPYGLPLEEKILPEYLKTVGYSTHLIGKWHLGFFEKQYSPNFRGFDSFYGNLGSNIDYFNHSVVLGGKLFDPWQSSYDMRRNLSITYDSQGEYITDVYNNLAIETINKQNRNVPLFLYLSHVAPHSPSPIDQSNVQVPLDRIDEFSYIPNENRQFLAAGIKILDEGIGKIISTLKTKGMLENSVIFFGSDNGAPVKGLFANGGSNYPLRGQKLSPWEGGSRCVGSIWSPLLKNRQRISNQLIHISDWLPTIAHLVGFDLDNSDEIDGVNMWPALSEVDRDNDEYDNDSEDDDDDDNNNNNSPRKDLLINYDNIQPYTSYIYDKWKFINGTTYDGKFDDWISDSLYPRNTFNTIFLNYGQAIKNSLAGQAFQQYSFSTSISQLNNKNNYYQYSELVLSAEEIEQLRENMKITCNNIRLNSCNPLIEPCLFNIIDDPCERYNLADEQPILLNELMNRVKKYMDIVKPSIAKKGDLNSNPAFFNNTWTYWYDEIPNIYRQSFI